MKSANRMAMELQLKRTEIDVQRYLDRYGFSPAETAEIMAQFSWPIVDNATRNQLRDAILNTLRLSIRLGDRLPDCIKWNYEICI